ncbi:hypothetical protein QO021_29080 (plasmid) [Pseudomonas amygdali pv. lachrymans]|uniref:hypothetical protein n=1 Tax=Pseudomonas amygdali TaxID=47877 RepID=UPI000F4016EA|nr:hypothetical protein [Pseudomonas amygdali]RMM39356.1 hypothetical protein ALQ79_200313 [Pseudomonas amygdali pv. lachrymans]WIO61614.1 hypothetical protein QO021_29080 [Pseudomonas amygdali pv. lachrymans]
MPKVTTAVLWLTFASLAGCTSAWISDPSPTTANLINDLKLEGFKCKAGFSTIECRQIDALVEKSAKLCSSEKGCAPQPCHDVRLVYTITQSRDGIPGIAQTTERTETRRLPSGDMYSQERIADLKEYCAIR